MVDVIDCINVVSFMSREFNDGSLSRDWVQFLDEAQYASPSSVCYTHVVDH